MPPKNCLSGGFFPFVYACTMCKFDLLSGDGHSKDLRRENEIIAVNHRSLLNVQKVQSMKSAWGEQFFWWEKIS